ncbi:transcriptional regulator [Lysinibacillus sp. NPDC093712]|uniref:transcriptional regulator n=1 Tax=Lysinibacillus sp. NPDC093712 TaxID=3390579 RepID=UPI003D074D33
MMKIEYLKPFYTKVTGNKLRLVFAHQYLSISKDNEIFHFIPIEGKEIIVNLDTEQVENVSEVFAFQKDNRFIRLPLYQLLLITNIHSFINPIIHKETKPIIEYLNDIGVSDKLKLTTNDQKSRKCEYGIPDKFKVETTNLLSEIMKFNKENLINKYLDDKNFDGLNDFMDIQF